MNLDEVKNVNETEDQKFERIEKVLEGRNNAINKIVEYNKSNDAPTVEEINEHFFKNEVGVDLSMDEIQRLSDNAQTD